VFLQLWAMVFRQLRAMKCWELMDFPRLDHFCPRREYHCFGCCCYQMMVLQELQQLLQLLQSIQPTIRQLPFSKCSFDDYSSPGLGTQVRYL